MSGASRESYAAAADRLSGYAAQATPEQLTGVAEELLAMSRLLGGQPGLRRALADSSRPAADRSGLLDSVFGGKVGADAVGLASTLVAGRWTGPVQLLDGFERLGVDALLAGAQRADDLGEIEDELFRFGQVVDGTPELAAVLSDESVELARRTALVSDLLTGKANHVTIRLAQLALRGFGGRGLAASLGRLVELTAQRRERQVAYVTTAVPLTEVDEQRLGNQLERMYGRKVAVKVTVDPKIIGGLSIQVGSDLYDGTVLRRLTLARGALGK
jgi:F-type H+-transporting ATPase subunit delta